MKKFLYNLILGLLIGFCFATVQYQQKQINALETRVYLAREQVIDLEEEAKVLKKGILEIAKALDKLTIRQYAI